ncbi:thioesterase family protein [Thalassotalea sp. G2M2-11]|uniref:thioesterase family protein n=1 Tax=Thalassotalea sp. G2M2-11 TaxID=2787627 RepID=UPI0019D03D53|nr:thioesterase family protein [Thalassotalea sp. G2M2-11]
MNQALIFTQIAQFWTNDMPFNQLLGFEIKHFDVERSEIRFPWNDKLIGNPMQKILHGGVTASVLDLAGGVVAAANIINQLDDLSQENIQQSLKKLGTIDLRTDFLRPGRGEEFIATAHIIRSGNKVAVARMELHNEKNDHIAFGTGTYMVG